MRLVLVLALALTACTTEPAPAPEPAVEPPPEPLVLPWSGTSATWADEMAAIDAQVTSMERLAAEQPGWTHLERAAGLRLQRARLSGDWNDYTAAEALITTAFSRATDPGGPHATRAALNYSVHRFDRVPDDLDALTGRMPRTESRRAQEAVLRGALALTQGDYDGAESELEAAFGLHPTNKGLSTLAVFRWQVGEFDAAEALFIEAAGHDHGVSQEPRAWTHLNLGLLDLDRSRFADALAHYRDAERELSGYWLVDEHIAEALMELGRIDEARALYEDVIGRTGGAPEFLDALAGLEEDAGNLERAQELRADARTAWEDLLARFPAAAAGHAIDHFLETHAHDRALEIATLNHAARPDGPAGLALAEAQLAAGQLDAARATLAAVVASRYDSPAVTELAERLHTD